MTLRPPLYSPRTLLLVAAAAFAAVAIALFVRWSHDDSPPAVPAVGSTSASLAVDGAVQVESRDRSVTQLIVPIVAHGDGIDMGPDDSGAMRAETSLAESASAAVPAEYAVRWSDGNGDRILDPGEHAVLEVELPPRSSVHSENPLRLVLTPPGGGSLAIEHVIAGD